MSHPYTMDLEILDKKIRRLVRKLKQYDVHLEVFDHADIVYGGTLGRGGEGVVHSCTVTYNGLPVDAAVKTVVDNSDDAISVTLEEIELLCLAHDPIVDTTLRVYGVAVVPEEALPEAGHLVIITEAGIMNALQLYQTETVPLHVTLDLWSRLAAAVHLMHTRRILHHDLKPDNVLITGITRNHRADIEKVDFKIIDLGMGKRVFTEKVVTDDILGTNGYHAPEVLFEDSYDFRVDIFMLGITFCVMLHPVNFLNDGGLQSLLKRVHSAKERQKVGRALYEDILEPSMDEGRHPTDKVKAMLCNMLEAQDRRTVSLLDIVHICREEVDTVKHSLSQAASRHNSCSSSHDSGIGSGSNEQKNQEVTIEPRQTRAASRLSLLSVEPSRARSSDSATHSTTTSGSSSQCAWGPRLRTKKAYASVADVSYSDESENGSEIQAKLRSAPASPDVSMVTRVKTRRRACRAVSSVGELAPSTPGAPQRRSVVKRSRSEVASPGVSWEPRRLRTRNS